MLADNIWRQLGEPGVDVKVDFVPSGRHGGTDPYLGDTCA